jgi:hypothetical protein
MRREKMAGSKGMVQIVKLRLWGNGGLSAMGFASTSAPSPVFLFHRTLSMSLDAASSSTCISWGCPERAAAFAAWLAATAPAQALLPASLRIASADASFRRYLRIDTAAGASRIIMDAPPEKENSEPFVRIAQLFGAAGLAVPEILAWDEAQGFMLLSDLGADTMMTALNPEQPEAALPLFQQAIDALVELQKASQKAQNPAATLPPYDEALLRRELQLFPDWYIAQHKGQTLDEKQQATLQTAFDRIVVEVLKAPPVFVHRDFMPRNLMLPTQAGAALGVLDFQDAVYGPITYDIASLMRDAFISWPEDFVLDVTVRYWQAARAAGLPVAEDFGEFWRAVEWMGLQRHLKVAGIFARLTLRDGKAKYLADAPRFIAYIRHTCSRYIELKPLLRLIDQIEGITEQNAYAFGRI